MRQYVHAIWVILLLAGAGNTALAQHYQGTVLDKADHNGIPSVTIVNKRTRAEVRTQADGRFTMDARTGDTLLLSHPAYAFLTKVIAARRETIYLSDRIHQLEGVEVLSPMAKYRQDSISHQQTYRKVIQDANLRPEAYNIGCQGCFSTLAGALTGQTRKAKNFVESFNYFEEQKFISVRYNAGVVRDVTGAQPGEAQEFVNAHPMDHDFARHATDLELKAWIAERYKMWNKTGSR